MIAKLFKSQRHERKTMLYIDEGMDFFGPTGVSRYGNAIQRSFRAGREKGMTSVIGLQRPKTINLQTLTEMNVLYLFRLQYQDDVKRLQEMGLPAGTQAPDEDFNFLWLRGNKLYPKALTIPERYVS